MRKYYELGYEVEDKPPPKNCKDYTKWLQEARKPRFTEKEMAKEKCL